MLKLFKVIVYIKCLSNYIELPTRIQILRFTQNDRGTSRNYKLPSSSGPDSFAAALFIFMACLRSNASNSFAVYSFPGIGSRLVPKCGYGAFGGLSFDILHPPDLLG